MILILLQPPLSDGLPLELPDQATLATLQQTINDVFGIPPQNQILTAKNTKLTNPNRPLEDFGLKNGDHVHLTQKPVYDPNKLAQLAREVRQTLQKPVTPTFDPMSAEGQEKILQVIRQQQIDQNFTEAQEIIPESFCQVHMLYVNLQINNVPIKAFVDSGAQNTIMSKNCAERCNVKHLVDTRFKGIARGLGEIPVIGKIHHVEIQCVGVAFSASMLILEKQSIDFLFGLDLLRRHQCCIDLQTNVLRIANIVELPFLSQHEIEGTVHE